MTACPFILIRLSGGYVCYTSTWLKTTTESLYPTPELTDSQDRLKATRWQFACLLASISYGPSEFIRLARV